MNVLELGHKPGDRAGRGTVYQDNVGALTAGDGSTTSVNSHNLFPGASAPNINGRPTFTSGTAPMTWSGYELPGSAGHLAATDGTDVGIRAAVAVHPGISRRASARADGA